MKTSPASPAGSSSARRPAASASPALASLLRPAARLAARIGRRGRSTPACRACRISRRRPSASSSSGKGAGRRTSICSTTSRCCAKWRARTFPIRVRGTTRLSTMSSGYGKWPCVPAIKPFKKYGAVRASTLSEMLPNVGALADDICVVRSMHTEAVNHAPGVTFFMTGAQVPGRPSMGAWLSLRPRQRDRQPADVRRDDLERQGQDLRPAVLRLLLGQRLSAEPLPGRPLPQHGRSGAVSGQSAGRQPRRRGGRCSTTSPP